MKILDISHERFNVVHREISDGSEPAPRFYILVAISTLIASFGLIANSTAVVIGAMLVAPLMTPIFGISLALVRVPYHSVLTVPRIDGSAPVHIRRWSNLFFNHGCI